MLAAGVKGDDSEVLVLGFAAAGANAGKGEVVVLGFAAAVSEVLAGNVEPVEAGAKLPNFGAAGADVLGIWFRNPKGLSLFRLGAGAAVLAGSTEADEAGAKLPNFGAVGAGELGVWFRNEKVLGVAAGAGVPAGSIDPVKTDGGVLEFVVDVGVGPVGMLVGSLEPVKFQAVLRLAIRAGVLPDGLRSVGFEALVGVVAAGAKAGALPLSVEVGKADVEGLAVAATVLAGDLESVKFQPLLELVIGAGVLAEATLAGANLPKFRPAGEGAALAAPSIDAGKRGALEGAFNVGVLAAVIELVTAGAGTLHVPVGSGRLGVAEGDLVGCPKVVVGCPKFGVGCPKVEVGCPLALVVG